MQSSAHASGTSTTHDSATREARRFLAARVRNNWEYPANSSTHQPAPHSAPLSHPAVDGASDSVREDTTASTWDDYTTGPLPFEPIGWRERGYSSSESTTSEPSTSELITSPSSKSGYMFDSPDTVAHSVVARQESRKRKHAQVLEQEMEWNLGLAHFVARRNAWTCARRPSDSLASAVDSEPPLAGDLARIVVGRVAGDSRKSSADMRSASTTPASSPPPANEPYQATRCTMLPIPEPILQDNPVRAKINSATYGEIYSKIILQCRTPTVPINLADVTKACVRGWMAEGNWPPKPGAADPLIGRSKRKGERHPHLRRSVQAVGRVFGLGGGDEKEKR